MSPIRPPEIPRVPQFLHDFGQEDRKQIKLLWDYLNDMHAYLGRRRRFDERVNRPVDVPHIQTVTSALTYNGPVQGSMTVTYPEPFAANPTGLSIEVAEVPAAGPNPLTAGINAQVLESTPNAVTFVVTARQFIDAATVAGTYTWNYARAFDGVNPLPMGSVIDPTDSAVLTFESISPTDAVVRTRNPRNLNNIDVPIQLSLTGLAPIVATPTPLAASVIAIGEKA